MRNSRQELERQARPKALQMLILMTDGQANRSSISASPSQFSIDEAYLAKASGIKIMTISLGAKADTGLMQQFADITGGEHFNVPGGASVATYAQDLKRIFGKIAADRALTNMNPISHSRPGRLPGWGMFSDWSHDDPPVIRESIYGERSR